MATWYNASSFQRTRNSVIAAPKNIGTAKVFCHLSCFYHHSGACYFGRCKTRRPPYVTPLLRVPQPDRDAEAHRDNLSFDRESSWQPQSTAGLLSSRILVCHSAASTSSPLSHGAAHPQALLPLYHMYCFACIVERTWRFGLPLVLAHIQGGFQAIALLGFASPLASSLLVPAVGQILDKTYRPYGLGAVIALQDVSILLSCLALIAAAARPATTQLVESPLFILLVFFSMVERLASAVSEMIIERDWVPQLAGKHNMRALAESNATLKRTDLVCELVGSLLFGWVYSQTGLKTSVALTSVVAIVALPFQLHSIYKIAKLAPGAMVHGREEMPVALFQPHWKHLLPGHRSARKSVAAELQEKGSSLSSTRILQLLKDRLLRSLAGWRVYFKQPILPSSLAYTLLFLNVVLSPGGLIFAFLASWGLGGMAAAVFKGGCAVMGFLGTWLGEHMIQTTGLLHAGQKALLLQVSLLSVASAIYFSFLSGPPELGIGGGLLEGSASVASSLSVYGIPLPVVAFAALIVLSRMGIWAYDMVNAQLFQQVVPQREISSASSAEMALCSFAELLMLGAAAYTADASSFPVLVCGSLGAVAVAAGLFTTWARGAGQQLEDDEVDEPPMQATAAAA